MSHILLKAADQDMIRLFGLEIWTYEYYMQLFTYKHFGLHGYFINQDWKFLFYNIPL